MHAKKEVSSIVRWLELLTLLLWRRDFLDHNTGFGVPSSKSVKTRFRPSAVADTESHTDSSPGNPFAISSNLTSAMKVEISMAVVGLKVHNTSNGNGLATFNAVEGKIPALTAY